MVRMNAVMRKRLCLEEIGRDCGRGPSAHALRVADPQVGIRLAMLRLRHAALIQIEKPQVVNREFGDSCPEQWAIREQ